MPETQQAQYPECDRLHEVAEEFRACSEFLEWLQSQGISLMHFGPMTDQRPCLGPGGMLSADCYDGRLVKFGRDEGECPLCGGTGFKEITVETYYSDRRSDETLVSEFLNLDQVKIEKERRAMLDAIRAGE